MVVNCPEIPKGLVEFVSLADGGKFRRDNTHLVYAATAALTLAESDLQYLNQADG